MGVIQSKAVLTVNAIAKKLSASNVLASLHRVVVIDNRKLSVVYRDSDYYNFICYRQPEIIGGVSGSFIIVGCDSVLK